MMRNRGWQSSDIDIPLRLLRLSLLFVSDFLSGMNSSAAVTSPDSSEMLNDGLEKLKGYELGTPAAITLCH
jgi:hypothetical protein